MSFNDFRTVSDPTPIAIYEIFNKHLDKDWYTWEPETLRMEVPGPVPEDRWSTIFATMAITNQAKEEDNPWTPWSEADIFGDICIAFQGIQHNPAFWQKPTLDQLWYAKKVLEHVDPRETLEEDVKAYIATCLSYDDVYFWPEYDEFIEGKITELTYGRVKSLQKEIARTWNDETKKLELINLPRLTPLCVQVLKIESARELVYDRLELGKRQISFVE